MSDARSTITGAATPTWRPPLADPALAANWRERVLIQWPAIIFLLPFLTFALAGMFEPTPPPSVESSWWRPDYAYYPVVYCVKLGLTILAIVFVAPGFRQFRGRVSWLAPLVGAAGAVLWIGVCRMEWVEALSKTLGAENWLPEGARAGFNPLSELKEPRDVYGFLAIRLIGLAIIAPLIEEMFLRGFLLRYIAHPNWWSVPPWQLSGTALAAGSLAPICWHPSNEWLAVILWFSLITALMAWTKNLWDCVVAHGVTNGLLGAYVIWSGHWELM